MSVHACQGKTLGQIAALGKTRERIEILMTHNFLAIHNLTKEFSERFIDLEFLRERLKDSKRRDIPGILSSMSEIEARCSLRRAI